MSAVARLTPLQEQWLVDFVETAAIGLHWVGADGTILWANRADYEPLGYTADEYIGHDIREFHADTDRIADILCRLSGGEGLTDYEARLRCKDGSIRWVAITSSVLFENGKFVHTRCFTRDITAKKAVEEELQRVSTAKDEFLALLGHELRNPLSPIVTALDLLRFKGQHSRELEVIERQVRHLSRLVDDLLDVSRIARGKVELRRERMDLASCVQQAIETVAPLYEQRKHQLVVDVPGPDQLVVDGDAARLVQVIVNLLSNAARYTPAAGEVRIAAARHGDRVTLRVRDNGAGIAPELLPRVFELFVQGKRAPDRAEGGLGLGLAIVQNLVRLHGGTVSAHSDGVGKGSEFVVELPAARAPRVAASAPNEAAGPRRRILLVDDNTDAADLLAQLLRTRGHDVVVAHSGPQALQLSPEFQPEVAVLDIGLPVMDGYELATRLRHDLSSCRLIALTGYGQASDRSRAREAGFDSHLVKPVQLPALLREVLA